MTDPRLGKGRKNEGRGRGCDIVTVPSTLVVARGTPFVMRAGRVTVAVVAVVALGLITRVSRIGRSGSGGLIGLLSTCGRVAALLGLTFPVTLVDFVGQVLEGLEHFGLLVVSEFVLDPSGQGLVVMMAESAVAPVDLRSVLLEREIEGGDGMVAGHLQGR